MNSACWEKDAPTASNAWGVEEIDGKVPTESKRVKKPGLHPKTEGWDGRSVGIQARLGARNPEVDPSSKGWALRVVKFAHVSNRGKNWDNQMAEHVMASNSDFKLGDWWVRTQRNQIERDGEVVAIESRSTGVLSCLAQHAPEVVTKETLLMEVWSDSPFVGEDVISHAIWELRKALGDSAREPRYIQTVPRKGYRLVAEVLRPQGSPLPIEGCQIDHYDLGSEIGRGAMGVVYQAQDRRLSRPVAIKFLAAELTKDPKACRRFEREARLAASLDHPNLATVLEIGETSQGYRYLVTPLYTGGSIKERLSEGPLEVGEALRLVRQLVAGLGAAHARDIVHRDIKPANLLLDEHGTLKICDFGIAKLLGGTDLTQTGSPLGTPAYKSPEQSQGSEVDHRTDLWSAGVVFYELLTGHRPFEGAFEHAVVHSILAKSPRPVGAARGETVSDDIERFVARALAKDPADRFQSAEAMLAGLDGIDHDERPFRFGSTRRWRLVAVPGVMSLVLLGAWWQSDVSRSLEEQAQVLPAGKDLDVKVSDLGALDGAAHLAQARRYWLAGNDKKTFGKVDFHLRMASEIQPDSAEVLGHLAVFLAERYATRKNPNHRDEALTLVDAILGSDPDSPFALVAQAWILLRSKQHEQAKLLAEKAIVLQPECGPSQICHLAHVVLAEAVWMLEGAEAAAAVLEEGIKVGGGYIRCRLKLAQVLIKEGEKDAAESLLLEVLGFEHQQTTALFELGNLYLEAWRPEEAIEYLNTNYGLTQDPWVLLSVGYAQFQRELWEVATETYLQAHEELIENGYRSATPMMAIGDIYLEQEDKVTAQHYYRQALEIFEATENPGVVSEARKAVCLAKLDRIEDAKASIQALIAEPRRIELSPDLLVYAARIYALSGDRELLFDVAERWIARGGGPIKLLDEDPAFRPYRQDIEYLRVVQPELMPLE